MEMTFPKYLSVPRVLNRQMSFFEKALKHRLYIYIKTVYHYFVPSRDVHTSLYVFFLKNIICVILLLVIIVVLYCIDIRIYKVIKQNCTFLRELQQYLFRRKIVKYGTCIEIFSIEKQWYFSVTWRLGGKCKI